MMPCLQDASTVQVLDLMCTCAVYICSDCTTGNPDWKSMITETISLPVVPDVYMIVAGSVGLGGLGGTMLVPSIRKSSHRWTATPFTSRESLRSLSSIGDLSKPVGLASHRYNPTKSQYLARYTKVWCATLQMPDTVQPLGGRLRLNSLTRRVIQNAPICNCSNGLVSYWGLTF